jgi:DNA-binding transcriptional MocR family regulator
MNVGAIAALVDECRKRSASFDYSGVVGQALVNDWGFLPEEREALASYLASHGSEPDPTRQVTVQRGTATALKIAGFV